MYKRIIDASSSKTIGYIDSDGKIYKGNPPVADTTFRNKDINSVFGSMINMGKSIYNLTNQTRNYMGRVGQYGSSPYDGIIKDVNPNITILIQNAVAYSVTKSGIFSTKNTPLFRVENGTKNEVYSILELFYKSELDKLKKTPSNISNRNTNIHVEDDQKQTTNIEDTDDWYGKAMLAQNEYHCDVDGDIADSLILYNGKDDRVATIPPFIKVIKGTSFWNLPKLESITFPNGIKKFEDSIIGRCDNLKKIIIPKSVTEIDKDAFISLNENTIICFEDKKENINCDIQKVCQGLIVLFEYKDFNENEIDLESMRIPKEQLKNTINYNKISLRGALETNEQKEKFVNTCNTNGLNIDINDVNEAIQKVGNENKEQIKMEAMEIKYYKLLRQMEFFEIHKLLTKLSTLLERKENYEKLSIILITESKLLLSGYVMYSDRYGKSVQPKERVYLYNEVLEPLEKALNSTKKSLEFFFCNNNYLEELDKHLPNSYVTNKECVKHIYRALKNPHDKYFL